MCAYSPPRLLAYQPKAITPPHNISKWHTFSSVSLYALYLFLLIVASSPMPSYLRRSRQHMWDCIICIYVLYTHSQMAIINKISDWQTCILTNKDVWIDQNQIDQAIYLFLFIHCNVMYVYTHTICVVRVSLSSAIYGSDDLRLTENKEIQHKLVKCTHTQTFIYMFLPSYTRFLSLGYPISPSYHHRYIKRITYILQRVSF